MAWRIGQPGLCKKRGIRDATPRIAAVGPGSDATVAVATKAAPLDWHGQHRRAARTLKVNDERAASQARPTYPGGRGNVPESRSRRALFCTGSTEARPFDAAHSSLPHGVHATARSHASSTRRKRSDHRPAAPKRRTDSL